MVVKQDTGLEDATDDARAEDTPRSERQRQELAENAISQSFGHVKAERDRIRHLAYHFWEEEGRPHDRHNEHWLRAEQELAKQTKQSFDA
ncbi:DUF2934 domain-containing protein [Rhizobium cauense]|uniref:DUF2934 domain-containing protein n=1 Tax=Rhizobium cauense TaxID=1166683 RepID=UPI001C6F054A|nr:DUF2934 domain-containing protein [Rhizobium cauense]MBW9117316.1 DUF2934 domain-containing protein [Rhizobium cauense]